MQANLTGYHLPRLSNRLTSIASLVPVGSRIVDIGTDHAFLPVFLVKTGIVASAVASDIAEGPLQKAEATIHAYQAEGQITLRKSNGLAAFSPGEADVYIIAGMGGVMVGEIIENTPWLKKNGSGTLLLQPMTRLSELRRCLYRNGFEIFAEQAVIDGGRPYSVIQTAYTGNCSHDLLLDHIGKLAGQPDHAAIKLLQREIGILQKKLQGARITNNPDEAASLECIIANIVAVLQNTNTGE